MFGKLLSLLDLLAASLILLYLVHFFPVSAVKYVAVYLVIKGAVFLLFSRDFASIVDVLFGIYLLLAVAGIYSNNFVAVIAIIWLVQKGVVGLA